MNRVVHQAKAALQTANQMWQELMSLVCTEPESAERCGWQSFWASTGDPKDRTRSTNHKATQKFEKLLGREEQPLRTVAEIYNPKRFGKRAGFGLLEGEAFDLTLGHNLLKRYVQERVW